jgi:hypothetical protein
MTNRKLRTLRDRAFRSLIDLMLAKEIPCNCSSFAKQYDHNCEHTIAISKANAEVDLITNDIKEMVDSWSPCHGIDNL